MPPPTHSPTQAPDYGPFGLDLTALNPEMRPGDDFFEFANGGYLARTVIPPDRSSATRRDDMTDQMERRLRELLERAADGVVDPPGDEAGKVGAFYASFMDEAAIERVGVAAIEPELSAIRAASDHAALAALMGLSTTSFYPSLFHLRIDADLKNPRRYAVYLSQSGLGLPDVDYYLEPGFAGIRAAYLAYATELLTLAGWPEAALSAQAAVAFEARIAGASWTQVQRRDPTTQYNPATVPELAALAPGFAWADYLGAAQIGGQHTLVLTQQSAIAGLAALFASTSAQDIQAWLAFRVIDDAAPHLARAFVLARFTFRDSLLGGQAELEPRWRRAIAAVSGCNCSYAVHSCFGTLKWAVGRLYVQQHFQAGTQAKIDALAAEVVFTFRRRIEALGWMTPPTRAEALKKLDAYRVKVGHPANAPAYDDALITRHNLAANVRAAARSDWAFCVRRSTGPVDREEWLLAPQAINAYSGSLMDAVFPAGILQAPFFDAGADAAVNFGAIGAVIGHELTHGFDDEGRATDSGGELRDWWAAGDAAQFNARAAVLGRQYAAYEVVPGVHINPALTMGENLADLGGLSIAIEAYHASLGGEAAPVLGGLSGDQRVFLGWAQVWAGTATPQEMERLTRSDPHAYRKFRVNGVVRNIDRWYAAFDVQPGDALYLAPHERARVW